MSFADAKQRFSSRVADYVRYRPGYPDALLEILRTECGLRSAHQVADIGSGTGLLSKLFVRNGNFVWGVEPNRDMSDAAVEFLAAYRNFLSVSGSAEATTLEDACVEFVTAGQAFHWFEPVAARKEFARILKPGGWLVIVWNDRGLENYEFGRAYEALLQKFGTDYAKVKDSYPEEQTMANFFGHTNFHHRQLPHFQDFDFEGLSGRLRSSSYAPQEGHAKYAPMMDALRKLFDATQQNGNVRMHYNTHVYFGQLDAPRS